MRYPSEEQLKNIDVEYLLDFYHYLRCKQTDLKHDLPCFNTWLEMSIRGEIENVRLTINNIVKEIKRRCRDES